MLAFKVILALLLLPSLAWGAASITDVTGTFTHGNGITITGSSFGTKATATPLIYDDFEGGTDGNDIDGTSPTYGPSNWIGVTVGGTVEPAFSNAQARHGNSSLNSYFDRVTDTGQFNSSIKISSLPSISATDRYYMSFWWRIHNTSTPGWPDNTKPWIINKSGATDVLYVGWGDPDTGDSSMRTGGTANSPVNGTHSQPAVDDIDQEWVRLVEEIEISTSGTEDGTRIARIHRTGTPAITAQHTRSGNQKTYDGNAWATVQWGSFYRAGEALNIWSDEIYFDKTWQRVEIGDNSVWANCTKREILVPTAWADTSITATLNQGLFGASDTVYVFVVDSAGNPSGGFEITLGGAGGGADANWSNTPWSNVTQGGASYPQATSW